jgi:hypothetical protein
LKLGIVFIFRWFKDIVSSWLCTLSFELKDGWRWGAQIPVARSPWRLTLLRWRLMFVDHQYGICFMPIFWLLDFWKICSYFVLLESPVSVQESPWMRILNSVSLAVARSGDWKQCCSEHCPAATLLKANPLCRFHESACALIVSYNHCLFYCFQAVSKNPSWHIAAPSLIKVLETKSVKTKVSTKIRYSYYVQIITLLW